MLTRLLSSVALLIALASALTIARALYRLDQLHATACEVYLQHLGTDPQYHRLCP